MNTNKIYGLMFTILLISCLLAADQSHYKLSDNQPRQLQSTCQVANCDQKYCSSNICKSCMPTYFLSSSKCQSCSDSMDNCQLCSNSTDCQMCEQRYLRNSNNKCALCSESNPHCLTCNRTNCLTCTNTYFLENNNCFDCSVIENCLQCISRSTCTMCVTEYYLSANRSCEKCVSPHCLYCRQYDNRLCAECEPEYFLQSNNCMACSSTMPNCLYCFTSSECQICQPSYHLQIGGYKTNCVLKIQNYIISIIINLVLISILVLVGMGVSSIIILSFKYNLIKIRSQNQQFRLKQSFQQIITLKQKQLNVQNANQKD